MIKISSRIKLPLKICQGSASTRHKSAEKNLAKFVNKVEPELNKKEELSLNRIQALLKESIPCRKIYIETIESVDDAGDNFLIHSNENGTLDALAIELQTNKNGKIGKQERNSLYHEAWHVFEHL